MFENTRNQSRGIISVPYFSVHFEQWRFAITKF